MARRAPGISFSRLRGELVQLPAGAVLVNDCYNANPISMARRARPPRVARAAGTADRRARRDGRARARTPPRYHREAAAHARELGIDAIVGVGELARDYEADDWAADPEAAVDAVAELLGPGDALLVKGSRSVGLEAFTDGLRARTGGEALTASRTRSRRGGCSMIAAQVEVGEIASTAIDRGEVLIAGMAAMLITIFLGPKFIDFLRVREFGQQIREEGPQEHHAKAGTPTMGGLIVFLAIAVPYLVLSDRDTASLAVFGVALGCATLGFADDFIKISKRRSLGLSARYKLLGQIALALALWWVAYRHARARPGARVADLRHRDLHRARCSTCCSSSW